MMTYLLIVVVCVGTIIYSQWKSPGKDTLASTIAEEVLENVTQVDINGDGKIGTIYDKKDECQGEKK